MVEKLNVVALISGGKDSLFSILHCIKNGHNVIALANLYPASASTPSESTADLETTGRADHNDEEIDSHMYQTVGSSVIPLYAEALGLPLYRQEITGTAVNKDRSYASSAAEADETESVVPLLLKVKAAHPELNAISTGAILSDYQRTRIESVALRLNLVPLAYLWQYPYLPPYTQNSLLSDMAAVEQDSRVIKVASGGLDERHLDLNISDTAGRTVQRLARDMGRYGGLVGGAVLGEGGEFETLAVDGPAPLWQRRIDVDSAHKDIIKDGDVQSLRLRSVKTEEKVFDGSQTPWQERLRVPEVWDAEFAKLFDHLDEHGDDSEIRQSHKAVIQKGEPASSHHLRATTSRKGSIVYISNIHSSTRTSVLNQMEHIKDHLLRCLYLQHLDPSSIAFTTILLRHMSDFAAVNASYSSLFTTPNPPARVTIACGESLPRGIDIILSAVVYSNIPPGQRMGLHVQSRSYWAPANIGPYSQGINVPLSSSTTSDTSHDDSSSSESSARIVYVAGQIPLHPASMMLVSQDFREQTVLALQHLWRIGRVMQVDWWWSCVAFITATDAEEARRRAHIAIASWKAAHHGARDDEGEDGEDEDEDIAERSLRRPWSIYTGGQASIEASLKTARRPLPSWNVLESDGELVPPMFVAEVAELPRTASIEWAALGLSFNGSQQKVQVGTVTDSSWRSCGLSDESTCMKVAIAGDADEFKKLLHEVREEDVSAFVEVYVTESIPEEFYDLGMPLQVIPCRSIWNMDTQAVYAAIRSRVLNAE